jgi:hypothetical protein
MSTYLAARSRRRSVRVASMYVAERLESRRLLAAVSWDGGGDGTNWGDPLNWSGNAIPLPADDVTINVAGSPTIHLGTSYNIHSLNNAETLNIHAGPNSFITLALEAASTNTGTIDFDIPTAGGYAGTLSIPGTATFSNSGIIRSTAAASSFARITGSGSTAFTNAAGGSIQVVTGQFEVSTSSFTQSGSITAAAGASLTVSSSTLNYLGGSNTGSLFAQNAVLNLQNASAPSTVVAIGAGDTLLGIGSANLTLAVRSGAFQHTYVGVPANMTNAGTILLDVVSEGGYLSALTLSDGVTLTNNGTIRSTAPSASYGQITGSGVAALTKLINNGTINVQDRELRVSGVTFTQNGTISNSGTGQLILNSAALVYTGGSNGSQFHVRNSTIDLRAASAASTVIANGGGNTFVQNLAPNLTLDVRADASESAQLFVTANATNAGILLLNVLTPGGYTSSINLSQAATLTNNGTIRAAAPVSVSDVRQVGGTNALDKLVNNGTLDVVGGEMALFNLTLEQHGSMTIAAASAITTSSVYLKYLGGSNADGLILRGSTFDLQAASAASTIYSESNNAFLGNASANLTINIRTSPTYGGAQLSVTTNATNAGTIVFGTSAVVGYASLIDIENGGSLNNTGTIRVAAGVNVNDTRQILTNNGFGTEKLVNNGTINLVGGNLDVAFMTFEQKATITVASGLQLLVNGGTLKYLGGSNTLGLAAYNSKFDLQAASAASTVSILGSNTLIGNAAPNLTIAVNTSTIYGGGTLNVPVNATNSGTIVFNAGNTGYTSQIVISNGATLTNNGTIRAISSSPSPFNFPNYLSGSGGVGRGILANNGTLEANIGDFALSGVDLQQQGAIHIAASHKIFHYAGKLTYLGGSNDVGLVVNAVTLDLQAASAASTVSVIGGSSALLGNQSPNLTISLDTNSTYGTGSLNVNVAAVNHGTILMQPDATGYSSQLQVNDGGAFTNAVDGIIKIGGSAVGGRYIGVANGPGQVASFNNLGLMTLEGDASVSGGGPITNNGTIRVTGNGLVYFSPELTNHALVDVVTGTFRLYGNSNVDDGTFLSGGNYKVASGATLGFGTSEFSSPLINTADIEVTGTGVLEFAQLNVNRGRIALLNGADFSVTPQSGTFALEGIIDLSPTSVFTITGNVTFAGISQPVVRSEIASLANFGRVNITGNVNLNSPGSTSRFDPDLVGGFDPALGAVFNVITATGPIINAFDSFQGGATPSGRIMTLQRPTANIVAVRIDPGPLPPAPQILSQTYEYLTRQAIVFQFSQDVSAFLSRKDYQLLNVTTGQTLAQSAGTLTFNTASNQATLVLTNELPDGDYRLTVNASDIANAAGVPASGSPIVLKFFSLAGDANHDRKVDFADLVILAQNYNLTGLNSSQGNVNYSADGAVDFADLVILAQQYNKNLGVAPPITAPLSGRGTAVTTGKGRVSTDVLS